MTLGLSSPRQAALNDRNVTGAIEFAAANLSRSTGRKQNIKKRRRRKAQPLKEQAQPPALAAVQKDPPQDENRKGSIDEIVENEENESVRKLIKDEGDKDIAKAVVETEKGEEPLDGDNETSKVEVKESIEEAIEEGAQKAEEKSEINVVEKVLGGETLTADDVDNPLVANRSSGNASAPPEIKESIDNAVDKTVRKEIQEIKHAAAENDTTSGIGSDDGGTAASESNGIATTVAPENATAANESEEAVIKQIKEKVEEAVDSEVKKALRENREPTEKELENAANEEIDRIWKILSTAKRMKFQNTSAVEYGPLNFWHSVAFFDWFLLLVTVIASMNIYRILYEWPSTKRFHGLTLFIWFGIAAVYNSLIFYRLGEADGILWMNGYILEIIFLIENVFVFHVVVKAFNMSRRMAQKALFVVVACQIIFQMIFYMGLAEVLRKFEILPYILGPWLLYCGYQACIEEDSHSYDIMESTVVKAFRACLGDRLTLEPPQDAEEVGSIRVIRDGKQRVSPMGLAVICLLIADFLLEIDVTVTKIENMENQYLCFSSSVVASFAIPELFFVARDLFKKFFALKYAIAFVLIFFGAQMLLHRFIAISAIASVGVIIGVMSFSVAISILMGLGGGYVAPTSPEQSRHQREAAPAVSDLD
jgi:tellurite resistance protein TerC